MFSLLLLLSISFAFSALVPSFAVSSCNNNEPCTNKLLVTVYISEASSGSSQLIITLDPSKKYQDSTGYSYVINDPVTIDVRWKNVRFEYDMTTTGASYKSASESIVTQSSCPTSSSSFCCVNTANSYNVRSLVFDSTAYTAYYIPTPSFKYELDIIVSQDNFTKTLSLSPTVQSLFDTGSGLTATILSTNVDTFALTSLTSYYYMIGGGSRFIVPKSKFCASTSSTNCLGMTTTAFNTFTRCSASQNLLAQMAGTTSYDQWYSFRSASIATVLAPTCQINSALSSSISSPPVESFDCTTQSNLVVLLELYAASFKIIKLYGIPYITNAGVAAVQSSDTYFKVFVDVSNNGNYYGVFELRTGICCYNSICSSNALPSTYINVNPYETTRIILYLTPPNGILFNVKIQCPLSIYQFGELYLTTNINFNSTSVTSSSSSQNSITCTSPNILWQSGNIPYCVAPCTIDQTFISSLGICTGINCITKYSGSRSFYNSKNGLCEAIAICGIGSTYSTLLNACFSYNSTSSNSSSTFNGIIPGSQITPSLITNDPSYTPTSSKLNCTNGYVNTANNHSCTCNSGWITSTNQDLFNYKWCSVYYAAQPTIWTNQPISTSSLLSIIGLSLAAAFALTMVYCLISYCIAKNYHENQNKPKIAIETSVNRDKIWVRGQEIEEPFPSPSNFNNSNDIKLDIDDELKNNDIKLLGYNKDTSTSPALSPKNNNRPLWRKKKPSRR